MNSSLPAVTRENTLICIFSFNRGAALKNCIGSTKRMCPGFPIVLIDDESDDLETLDVIQSHVADFIAVLSPQHGEKLRKHGNLSRNIQIACDLARERGYAYAFLVQDDMQFVRPFRDSIIDEYTALFRSAPNVLQVDPRFLRKVGQIELNRGSKSYHFPESDFRHSYSDVGILSLRILKQLNWQFLDSEHDNKIALSEIGFWRLFPFTPIMMHTPFPRVYASGKLKKKKFAVLDDTYEWKDMSEEEILKMDSRPLSDIPYFRKYLSPKNMGWKKLIYKITNDVEIFR